MHFSSIWQVSWKCLLRVAFLVNQEVCAYNMIWYDKIRCDIIRYYKTWYDFGRKWCFHFANSILTLGIRNAVHWVYHTTEKEDALCPRPASSLRLRSLEFALFLEIENWLLLPAHIMKSWMECTRWIQLSWYSSLWMWIWPKYLAISRR